MDEAQEKIKTLERRAENLIERTVGGALGKEFKDRKEELRESLKWWKGASVISIIFLIGSSVFIYFDLISLQTTVASSLAKITLIIPLSVAVWFSVSNYNRQKRLMEEYEFKARVAFSLDGYREVLKEDVNNDDNEIVAEFVSSTMEKIYSNPHNNMYSSQNEAPQQEPSSTAQSALINLMNRMGK